jgi:hypothetical protein
MLEAIIPDLVGYDRDNKIISWELFSVFMYIEPILYTWSPYVWSVLGYPRHLQHNFFSLDQTLLLQIYEGAVNKVSDLFIYFPINNADLKRCEFDKTNGRSDTN